jgi:hypothetical protein
MGLYGLNWSGSGLGPVEGSCVHDNEPLDSIHAGKFLSSYTTGGFSRRAQLHGVSNATTAFHLILSHSSVITFDIIPKASLPTSQPPQWTWVLFEKLIVAQLNNFKFQIMSRKFSLWMKLPHPPVTPHSPLWTYSIDVNRRKDVRDGRGMVTQESRQMSQDTWAMSNE